MGCRDESVSFYNQKARVLWPTYGAAGIKIFNSPFSHDKSMVNVSGKVYMAEILLNIDQSDLIERELAEITSKPTHNQ